MGKEDPERTTSLPSVVGCFVGAPTLIPYHRDAGESMRLSHWESDCHRGEGRNLQQPAHRPWQTEFILAVPKW